MHRDPANEDCLVLVLGMPGVDPNVQHAEKGNTALRYAAFKDVHRAVELLLGAPGIDVNLANKWGDKGV